MQLPRHFGRNICGEKPTEKVNGREEEGREGKSERAREREKARERENENIEKNGNYGSMIPGTC